VVGDSSVVERASKVHTFSTHDAVKLATGGRLVAGTVTVTLRWNGTAVTKPFASTPRANTVYAPAGITGDVYEKFEPGEPGLLRNAARQLNAVPENTPEPFMNRPRLSRIAISTRAI
jgi:hypothetical protein